METVETLGIHLPNTDVLFRVLILIHDAELLTKPGIRGRKQCTGFRGMPRWREKRWALSSVCSSLSGEGSEVETL